MKKITILLLILFCIITYAQAREINVLSNKLSISLLNPITNETESLIVKDQINIINIDKDLSYITIQLISEENSKVPETVKFKILGYKVENSKDFGEMLKLYSKNEKGEVTDYFLTTKFFMMRSKLLNFKSLMVYELVSE